LRLDVFLKRSRIVKRRALAKELCEDGAVTVNGRRARAGKDVSVGDRLSVRLWSRLLEIEIEQIPEGATSKAESRTLYRLVSEKRVEEEV
jgi:ribosomal 50S subunit-recycling heat shock protein